MMFKSIRTRLTLWYVFVLSIILILFCFLLYFSIKYILNEQVNRELLEQADYIADSYHSDSNTFPDLPEHDFKTNPLLWFRIVQRDGSLFQPAPTFKIFGQPFPLQLAQKLPHDTPLLETFKLVDQKIFRSIIFPIDVGLKRIGWVQLIKPISDMRQTLKLIQNFMILLVPFAVLILTIGGHFLARKTLHPIEVIREQVDQICDQNLSQRIQVINPNDELGSLTQTFNQMLERLQIAFESQRRFLADASHELKTPITILRSQWEKISETKDLPIKLQHQIQTDIEELARLAKLVDHLLLLAAIDDNRIKIEQKPVDLADALQEVYEDGKILAESKNQQIKIDRLKPAIIIGERNRLIQLFLNLLDNAVKYTPEHGTISLSLHKNNDKVIVEVRDSGIGISPKDIPYLFDRFYRVDKSRSRKLGGSGLGLSICQWIVTVHGGKLKINSEPGKGTRVVVEFTSIS